MATFEWSESYSVRVQRLDEQHKVLFATISSLADAMRAGRGEDVIRDVVHKLAVYTLTHFLQEEVLMRQTGYPALEAHRELHGKLLAEVEKYKRDLNEGHKPNAVGVLAFLREWLVQHIQKADKAYSDHLNAHGIR